MTSPALVLFDIDGTLLRRSGPHHRQALLESIRSVTGLAASFDGVSTHGMLDRDLLVLLLKQLGLSRKTIKAALPELMHAAQKCYIADCPSDLRTSICPGVAPLLEELTARDALVGLVTGNLSAIGWKKVEVAGLRSYFRVGAFSEHGTTRAMLARAAIREARREHLLERGARISLIGDHPNDIRAARTNRIQAIATATGLSPIEELEAAGPDLLVRDLSELTVNQLL